MVAVALFAPAPAAAQSVGPVLVVGDSLEVGTEPYLRQELPGTDLTVDALKGRPSSEGVEVLRAAIRPEHEVVVFDLGTNDDPANPSGLAASLDAAREIAGDRCLVVATINRPPLAGVSDAGLNGVVRRFAASTGAQVADWRAAAAEPGVLGTDGVHGTADGYAVRGALVADAIRSCGVQADPSPGAAPRPPKPVEPPPPPEFGPGLALVATPFTAVGARMVAMLGFAADVARVVEGAVHPLGRVASRLLGEIGTQPAGGE